MPDPQSVLPNRVDAVDVDARDPAGEQLRAAIGATLVEFLSDQRVATAALGDELEPLHRLAAELTAGGKRLRPALCVWGWVAAGGEAPVPTALIRAAASLELLHVSALVHDDVMDGSDLRRGAPSAHRRLERWHAEHDRLGDPAAFGRAGTILLGDLLLMWSAEMLQRSGIGAERLLPALGIVEAMRTEVTGGQFLDVLAQTAPLHDEDGDDSGDDFGIGAALGRAERVTEFKSARYTVVRPLQLGAGLAGGDATLSAALEAFGLPLGRAFQYRDDLLGVFGDSALTGKPAGDDLREGKRTVLIAHARDRLTTTDRAELDAALGRPDLDADGIERLQTLIAGSGAVEAVETMIASDHGRALAALEAADLTTEGRQALTTLARLAVDRSS